MATLRVVLPAVVVIAGFVCYLSLVWADGSRRTSGGRRDPYLFWRGVAMVAGAVMALTAAVNAVLWHLR